MINKFDFYTISGFTKIIRLNQWLIDSNLDFELVFERAIKSVINDTLLEEKNLTQKI